MEKAFLPVPKNLIRAVSRACLVSEAEARFALPWLPDAGAKAMMDFVRHEVRESFGQGALDALESEWARRILALR